MKRPNAIQFGQDLEVWDAHKDMKRDDARFLVPLAPIAPKKTLKG